MIENIMAILIGVALGVLVGIPIARLIGALNSVLGEGNNDRLP
jgi:hypothetical protein